MQYEKISIFTDGGSRGNPGPAAIGVNALNGETPLFKISQTIGHATNNFAEYTALIESLKYLDTHQISSFQISFFLDSELVVKQINGLYKVKDPHIQILFQETKSLISKLLSTKFTSNISFSHIPREKNKVADALVNAALDAK